MYNKFYNNIRYLKKIKLEFQLLTLNKLNLDFSVEEDLKIENKLNFRYKIKQYNQLK